ncbi:antibiotic biosynthesis monooxygenase (ABM) superfamily enzyme [Agromyces albus]|nr:antibiotic biosynthesis monooxygenase (ABM) superfamily enzyme [Agromyces albus]
MTATPPEHGRPVPNADSPPSEARTDPPVPPRPNAHVTALIVWLTIFPLVAIFSTLLGPVMIDWHPVLRALVLTLVVVPIAAYWLMPQMFRWYGAWGRRRAMRRAGKPAQ